MALFGSTNRLSEVALTRFPAFARAIDYRSVYGSSRSAGLARQLSSLYRNPLAIRSRDACCSLAVHLCAFVLLLSRSSWGAAVKHYAVQ
ncbi:hypothetical protein BAUCODRAFT_332503 [Baudoinia panamericana UAMH 10762]|uniref:Uncharacterized protein n=1 Tax=Baudoinia panamericana (strain UAMH 10762) TaxID=717646 RepID=M2MXI0_BAUPA|nr:uncharacterized protein BAUCODRAFT_332503 [Baudoinia panamericana UAMH 10762]EMC90960.1 hypothetical protein BAUCODRAFT_332503 [Baudoinia panamericana UAMH 10762]